MKLIKLIYVSTASDEFALSSIDEIMKSAHKHNTEDGITGVLYYDGTFFMQYLEGGEQAVDVTYSRICKDKRHRNIRMLDKSPIETRQFGDWSMAYILQSEVLKPLHLKFMDSADFDPYRLNAHFASEMITEMRNLLPQAYLQNANLVEAHR